MWLGWKFPSEGKDKIETIKILMLKEKFSFFEKR